MKIFLATFFLCCQCLLFSQEKVELTPTGFAPVEIARPDKTNEKLIEASKSWADSYNKVGNDVYDVTANTLSIDAVKNNAFYYRNLGESFNHRIRYTLKVVFGEKTCTVTFIVKEIYARKVLTELTIADFFTPEGKLKEDYEEVKPSLELTANNILRSYINFISQ